MGKQGLLILGVLGGTLVLIVGFAFLGGRPRPTIADVKTACVQHTGIGMHIHPHLAVILKGEAQTIPANVGIDAGCMHPIHTHDDSGTLHLEFPTTQDVRLGQFFEIWGKTFSSQCIFDWCTGEEGTVTMTVNGQENTEFENYMMKDGDRIEIRYE